jgi:hypothetical protein
MKSNLPRSLHPNRISHLIIREVPASICEFSHGSRGTVPAIACEALESSSESRDHFGGVMREISDSFGDLPRNQQLVGMPPSDICRWDAAASDLRSMP